MLIDINDWIYNWLDFNIKLVVYIIIIDGVGKDEWGGEERWTWWWRESVGTDGRVEPRISFLEPGTDGRVEPGTEQSEPGAEPLEPGTEPLQLLQLLVGNREVAVLQHGSQARRTILLNISRFKSSSTRSSTFLRKSKRSSINSRTRTLILPSSIMISSSRVRSSIS